jgi:RNA-directed DNA polymerase
MGYFGLASQRKLFDRRDQWIRQRIRVCHWGQWRRPKTGRRNLIRLGVPRRQAIRHARIRQGYGHMAKTIASGVGLTNAWLAAQGLEEDVVRKAVYSIYGNHE